MEGGATPAREPFVSHLNRDNNHQVLCIICNFFQVSRCLPVFLTFRSFLFRQRACCLCVHECASLLGRRTSASSSAFTSPLSIRSLHLPPTTCSLCVMKVTHVGVIEND